MKTNESPNVSAVESARRKPMPVVPPENSLDQSVKQFIGKNPWIVGLASVGIGFGAQVLLRALNSPRKVK